MNLIYIKAVVKDLEEVLTSKESSLCDKDLNKLRQAKKELENAIQNQSISETSIEDKVNYVQILVFIIEILKSISDHWK